MIDPIPAEVDELLLGVKVWLELSEAVGVLLELEVT